MVYGSNVLKSMVEVGSIKNTYEGSINPASINLRLGDSFTTIDPNQPYVKLGDDVKYIPIECDPGDGHVIIYPGDFMLATTKEWIYVPIGAAAFVQGRSSIGRAGLSVQNAGYVDPGFRGHITLELKNDGPVPIVLLPGYPVTQLVYMDAEDVEEGYDGKYNNQVEATGSRMHEDIYKPGHQKEVTVNV